MNPRSQSLIHLMKINQEIKIKQVVKFNRVAKNNWLILNLLKRFRVGANWVLIFKVLQIC